MKIAWSMTLISLLLLEPVALAQQASGRPFVLEDGTPVKLVLDETISSSDARVGQMVNFEVVDDVKVGDTVVVPRGSTAWATVTEAQSKRRMGRGGKLDMNIDKVRLADGEKVLLRANEGGKGGGHQGAMVGAMVATSIFTLGGSALFLLMHGKDITIPKGSQVTAFIQGDVTLDPAKFTREALQPPPPVAVAPASEPARSSQSIANPPGAMTVVDEPAPESLGDYARKIRNDKANAASQGTSPQ